MTLELIIFIVSVLFGAFLYWRESQGNRVYRFFNKILYSKELQMKPEDKTGFFYQQKFLPRLVFTLIFFFFGIVIFRFFIPIDLATISIFASMIAGTLIGTYLTGFIFKSGDVIEDQSDSIEDLVHDTIEKGKDFIEDLTDDEEEQNKTEPKQETPEKTTEAEPKQETPEEKSARERLKDKGLL